jgi:hypothetical protein
MVERPKSGTSINNLRLSELGTTTNHLISRTLEETRKCKFGALMLDGIKFSDSRRTNLSTWSTEKLSLSQITRMLKDKALL